jgi:uncharacterized spore protein YtfJ
VLELSEKMTEILKSILSEVQKAVTVKVAIGEPIEIEDKIFIPIFGVGVGVGGGGRLGKEQRGGGGGFGGGGGIVPVAVLVVFKGVPGPEGVKILMVKPSSAIAQVIGEAASVIMGKLMPSEGKPIPEEKKEKLKEI